LPEESRFLAPLFCSPLTSERNTNKTLSFVVLDRNGNGTIDVGAELFGDLTPQPAGTSPNGFLALAEYDKSGSGGNGDGKITASDAIFSQLKLWQDFNHNGVSEPSELRALTGVIEGIDLNYKEAKRTIRAETSSGIEPRSMAQEGTKTDAGPGTCF
jgi:hypothetical protein